MIHTPVVNYPVMKYKLILICVVWTFTYHCVFCQNVPELPNTSSVITCLPDTAGYVTVTVGPAGRDYTNLQEAIDESQLGTIIKIDAGVTFFGGFQLPAKGAGDKWIILMSSHMELLPPSEVRINPDAPTGNNNFPTQKDAMPKIITNNLSGIPAIKTQLRAHHYWLMGIEVTAADEVLNSYGLVNLGDGSAAQNTLDKVPHDFVVDRCFIHGHTQGEIMKFGIRLDCANAAILDSYISDFHSIGFDAQAIAGINGPGPFIIFNNYLEASGENILIGGGAAAIPGLVPSDIEIRQNHFYKPWSWRVGHPEYAGKHWTIKNLFELKTGKRVLLDGNILENSWADLPVGQSGYAILLTIRTENGGSPQADVSDITIRNNIIRHVGAGISLSGTDDGGIGMRSARIKISNNLFEDVNGTAYGDLNIFGPNDGTFLKIKEPKDVCIDHNTVFQTGPVTWAYDITDGFIFTNNIVQSFVSPGGYRGIYGPGQTEGNNTIARYFPDITDANQHFHRNVLIAGDASKYSNYNSISQNYFAASIDDVGFIDFAGGTSDYHGYALSEESPFYDAATDGSAIGVNFNKLDSAFNYDRNCNEIISATQQAESNQFFELFPNPAHNLLNIKIAKKNFPFRIYDFQGHVILSGILNDNNNQISIRHFKSGPYIFVTSDNQMIRSQIFIVAAQ